MTLLRRRIVRPCPVVASNTPRERRKQRLRDALEHELQALARWQPRLRRAFTTVQKFQRRIADLERQLARLED